MTSKEFSQESRKYRLRDSETITIDESAKEDVKKMMNWSEIDWKLHTKLLMKTNECQISSSEDEQILKELGMFSTESILSALQKARQSENNKTENDRRTAGRCLRFKYGRCSNKGCENTACPLNEELK